METHQTLSLIGNILGILLTIGLFLVMGTLIGTSDVLLNMSHPSPSEIQTQESKKAEVQPFIAGLAFAFIFYIVMLVLTFVIRNKTKALGIILILMGFIAMAITNFWGVIPFALLLPAGIVALRHKSTRRYKYDEREEDKGKISKDTVFCQKCEKPNSINAKFCSQCGNELQ